MTAASENGTALDHGDLLSRGAAPMVFGAPVLTRGLSTAGDVRSDSPRVWRAFKVVRMPRTRLTVQQRC